MYFSRLSAAGWVLIVSGLATAHVQSPIAILISVFGVVVALLKKFVDVDPERHKIESQEPFFFPSLEGSGMACRIILL